MRTAQQRGHADGQSRPECLRHQSRPGNPAPVTPQVRATHPPPPAASCPAVTVTMRLGGHAAVLGHHQAFARTRRPRNCRDLPEPLSQDTRPRRRPWAARGRSDGGAIPRNQACVSCRRCGSLIAPSTRTPAWRRRARSARPALSLARRVDHRTRAGIPGLSTANAASPRPRVNDCQEVGASCHVDRQGDQHWKRAALGINNRTGCPC